MWTLVTSKLFILQDIFYSKSGAKTGSLVCRVGIVVKSVQVMMELVTAYLRCSMPRQQAHSWCPSWLPRDSDTSSMAILTNHLLDLWKKPNLCKEKQDVCCVERKHSPTTKLHIKIKAVNFTELTTNSPWYGAGKLLSDTRGMQVTGLLVRDMEYSEGTTQYENVPTKRNERLVMLTEQNIKNYTETLWR